MRVVDEDDRVMLARELQNVRQLRDRAFH